MNRENFLKKKSLLFIFIAFSMIGWLYESMLFITRGLPFENRGFLWGPYLPIYGLGGLIVVFICFKLLPEHVTVGEISIKPLVIFCIMIMVSTGVEWIVGYLLDYFWGLRLWDYRYRVYNLGGYICIGASLRFGVGGLLMYYFLFPWMDKLLKQDRWIFVFNGVLSLIIMGDGIVKLMKLVCS
ncbi:MAG: putative ABC transporter permease [Tissierellia bacterium]|nr:putative ABC transporter permease [Tissierellia bacterium]